MREYIEKEFVFKSDLVEYIADHFSEYGNALSDEEYDELSAIYGKQEAETYLVDRFKDFWIYRKANGYWIAKRRA